MCGRAGFDQGLGDGLGGRRRLLPSQQRDRVGSERRERAPLDAPARPDHAAQRSRHQEPIRDPLGERHHIQLNAGQPDSTYAQTDAQSENILHPVTSASLSQVGVLSKRLDGSSWSLAQRISSTYELHTHTHTRARNARARARLTALCPGLPRWVGTRKIKPIWILLKQETVSGSGISWDICNSAPRSKQITMPAPHHSVGLQAGCPSCYPTNSVKALRA